MRKPPLDRRSYVMITAKKREERKEGGKGNGIATESVFCNSSKVKIVLKVLVTQIRLIPR